MASFLDTIFDGFSEILRLIDERRASSKNDPIFKNFLKIIWLSKTEHWYVPVQDRGSESFDKALQTLEIGFVIFHQTIILL